MLSVEALKTGLVRTIYHLAAIKSQGIHRLLGFRRIADALDRGDLGWSQARELCRRARPDDQRRWLELARALSRVEFRRLNAAPTPRPAAGGSGVSQPTDGAGDQSRHSPDSSPAPRSEHPLEPQHPPIAPIDRQPAPARVRPGPPRPEYVTFRFTPEQLTRFHALLESPALAGANRSLEERALRGLATARGPGRAGGDASYLVVLLQCLRCGRADLRSPRGEVPAAPSLLAAAMCDAVVEDPEGRRRHVIPPRLRRLALQRARYRRQADGCSHTSFLEIHHRRPLGGGGTDDLDNLVVLCSRCHRRLHEAEDRARRLRDGEPPKPTSS